MLISDRLTGLFLVGLGALAAYGGSLLPPVPGQQVGPSIFPMVVGIGLCLCGVLIALRIGHNFEAEAEVEAGIANREGSAPRSGWWALLAPALLLFYFFAVDRLGFVLTAAIIAGVTAISLRASLKLAIAVAVLSPLVVHLIFGKLLRVPLSPGLLPLPW
jgi:putative tricarboxylic transport membrane protein